MDYDHGPTFFVTGGKNPRLKRLKQSLVIHSDKLRDPLKMCFLLNMGVFQPAVLVYQRVSRMEALST